MVHTKPPTPLGITPPPFKPSHLSIPASPFSPRTPLPQTFHPQHRSQTLPTPDTRYVPPPPLQWLWQCHQCRRTYSLGVTRRCLEDGHEFCAGTTTVKTWRRPLRAVRAKRGKACASEFDYQGWKAWGRWKRSGETRAVPWEESSSDSDLESDESSEDDFRASSGSCSDGTPAQTTTPPKDCWNMCDYPSECRWGKRFGVHTPVVEQMAVTLPPIESFQAPTTSSSSSPPTTFDGILKAENCAEGKREKKGEKTDFWGALVASATRRKGVPASSPLAREADVVGEVATETAAGRPSDKDGDVVMGNGDLDLAALQAGSTATLSGAPVAATPSMTRSASVVSLKDIIRKGAKRSKASVRLPGIKEKVGAELYEQALGELGPVEKVKSRDSGYQSTPEG